MATAQDGFTPLHFCSQAGCAEGCRLLLGAEAEVDAKLHKTNKVCLKVFVSPHLSSSIGSCLFILPGAAWTHSLIAHAAVTDITINSSNSSFTCSFRQIQLVRVVVVFFSSSSGGFVKINLKPSSGIDSGYCHYQSTDEYKAN